MWQSLRYTQDEIITSICGIVPKDRQRSVKISSYSKVQQIQFSPQESDAQNHVYIFTQNLNCENVNDKKDDGDGIAGHLGSVQPCLLLFSWWWSLQLCVANTIPMITWRMNKLSITSYGKGGSIFSAMMAYVPRVEVTQEAPVSSILSVVMPWGSKIA